jgi:hypothetical protein
MRRANIKGALVGVEAVTPKSLRTAYKHCNDVLETLIARLCRSPSRARPWLLIFGRPSEASVHVPGDP